ncbi:hypothetical protein SLEP1_g26259 [Rubroshorea leprosula]|uniref:Uncharacterized protein n=1 Tax=Rubroshorea leprosula TaxID=152421 RepID=A0AAV5JTK3_9ROSI|nr:hypothetical protein SLEP1_g26259 [Rubroshorea leprosula]
MANNATELRNNDGEGGNLGRKRKDIQKRSKAWLYFTSFDDLVTDTMKKLGTAILGGKDIHMRCVAHIINLAIGEGTKDKEMNKSVTAIKVVVK